jgi:Family of unknown function (DUF5906)
MTSQREKDLVAALPRQSGEMAKLEELRYDVTQDGFWDIVNGNFYSQARSVNGLVPKSYWPLIKVMDAETGKKKEVIIKPATWLAAAENGLIVNDSVWLPGEPLIITGRMVSDGMVVPSDKRNILFNTYKEPPKLKSKKKADRWIEHVKALWPNEEEHNFFFDVCAHMVQRPEEKLNAVIVLSGEQGIGKDVALIPVKAAIGLLNVRNVSPDGFMGQFNSWVRLMLVIDELQPTKEDFHASSLYERLKTYSVTPPDMIAINDKFMKTRWVKNVLRIFMTTNTMTALYVHPNDRRFAILHSPQKTDWKTSEYFTSLASWLESEGGNAAVAQWLRKRDISHFEPKKRPVKTAAFRAVAAGWAAPDSDAVAQALDKLNNPQAFFANELLEATKFSNADEDMAKLLRQPRRLVHRLQQNNYFLVPLDPPLSFKGSKEKNLSFKTAYAKYDLMSKPSEVNTLLNERGQMLADGVAILQQQKKATG